MAATAAMALVRVLARAWAGSDQTVIVIDGVPAALVVTLLERTR